MTLDGWLNLAIAWSTNSVGFGLASLVILSWWMLGKSAQRRKRRITLVSMWLKGFRIRIVLVKQASKGPGRALAIGLELCFVSKQQLKTDGFIQSLPIGVSLRSLKMERRDGGSSVRSSRRSKKESEMI